MRGYELHTLHKMNSHEITHHVTLYKQPWYRIFIATVYHWYDMRVYKVPGFRLLEDFLRFLDLVRKKDSLFYIPLSAKQDERCYYLQLKGKKTLIDFEITEAEYNNLK